MFLKIPWVWDGTIRITVGISVNIVNWTKSLDLSLEKNVFKNEPTKHVQKVIVVNALGTEFLSGDAHTAYSWKESKPKWSYSDCPVGFAAHVVATSSEWYLTSSITVIVHICSLGFKRYNFHACLNLLE